MFRSVGRRLPAVAAGVWGEAASVAPAPRPASIGCANWQLQQLGASPSGWTLSPSSSWPPPARAHQGLGVCLLSHASFSTRGVDDSQAGRDREAQAIVNGSGLSTDGKPTRKLWPPKGRRKRTTAWTTDHFKHHLHDDSLSNVLAVLRKLQPGKLDAPLAFTDAQNFVLMILRGMLLSDNLRPEELHEGQEFMLDCICHVARDEVTKLGPHPYVVRLWLGVAVQMEHRKEEHYLSHITLAMSRILRTPPERFTQDDVHYFQDLLYYERLEQRLPEAIAYLAKIDSHWESFRNSERGQKLLAKAESVFPPRMLNFNGQELYTAGRLQRHKRAGQCVPQLERVVYRIRDKDPAAKGGTW